MVDMNLRLHREAGREQVSEAMPGVWSAPIFALSS